MSKERPAEIPGYVHPVTDNSNHRSSVYKTFNEEDTKKKKDMKEFKTVKSGNQYANRGGVENEEEKCPICKKPQTSVCPCGYNDKTCSEGHTWWTDRDGKIKTTNPH
jgi:hypothetical protein